MNARMKSHRRPQRSASKGFTLIELLIVVAIIGILAAIAVPNYLSAQTRAKVVRARSDMRTIATAITVYQVDNGVAPPTFGPFAPAPFERLRPLTTPVEYLSVIPLDPFQPEENRNKSTSGPGSIWDGYYVYNIGSGIHGGVTQLGNTTQQNGWSLTSAGPDGDIDFPYYYYGPNFAVNDRHLVFNYDPTNGVVSSGDIFQQGGARNDHY